MDVTELFLGGDVDMREARLETLDVEEGLEKGEDGEPLAFGVAVPLPVLREDEAALVIDEDEVSGCPCLLVVRESWSTKRVLEYCDPRCREEWVRWYFVTVVVRLCFLQCHSGEAATDIGCGYW